MHFRWLQYGGALFIFTLHCFVVPIAASLKVIDTPGWIKFIQSNEEYSALVLLYDESSPVSLQAEQIIEDMESQGEIAQLIPDLQLMKQKRGEILSTTFDIQTFPALVLIRDGRTAIYTDKMESYDSIYFWLEKAGPKAMTKVLTDDTLEHLTQASTGSTTGHWAVLFYKPSCNDHFAVLESLGVNEKLWMSVAIVDLDTNPKLQKRFKVTDCPELIYFREGKMYRYETKKWDIPSLTTFVKSWYRNVKGSPVPVQPTAFDALTEGIAKYLKDQLEGENRTMTLVVIAGFAVTLVLTSIFCCLTGGSDSKQKKE
ncbi:uncharacterized protein [Littorina saxatilis]|uniref:Thioredoxin domain-containing protein n=1 Tax=Littorina saxatilis TaxID=31220 RepID=A0AAN9AYJ9_9CAEN